jgi:hypothetical protein
MSDEPITPIEFHEIRIDLEPYQFDELRPFVEHFFAEATEGKKCAVFAQVFLMCSGDPMSKPDSAVLRCWYLPNEASTVIDQALKSISHLIPPVHETNQSKT